nr:MAG TPA: hypothetical protein [Herelleviridae sp.]
MMVLYIQRHCSLLDCVRTTCSGFIFRESLAVRKQRFYSVHIPDTIICL